MTQKLVAIVTGALLAGGLAVGCGGKKDENKGKVVKTNDNTQPATNTGNTGDTGNTATKTAASGGDYQEMDSVPDAGKITGTVTYTGDKKAPPLKVTKDPEVCSHGGEPDGSLVVTDGKLKNAIVYLDGITKGKKWDDGNPTIDNKECLFDPRVSIVKQRGEVTALNSDPLLHNTNLVLKDGNKSLANIALPTQGQKAGKVIKKTGLVEAKCDVHEWMTAFVWSTPHPYAVVTAADGTFTLTDVPPGDYKLRMWHETLGEAEMPIKVEAGGEAKADHEYK